MSERELSDIDQLVEIEDRTNDDGTVNVTIEGWERVDRYHADHDSRQVVVEFELIDSTETDTMLWPKPGGDLTNYKFYRLVNQAGLEMRNADLLEGEPARADRTDGDWTLDVPEHETTQDKVSSTYDAAAEWASSVPWRHVIITSFWIVSVLAIVGTMIALV